MLFLDRNLGSVVGLNSALNLEFILYEMNKTLLKHNKRNNVKKMLNNFPFKWYVIFFLNFAALFSSFLINMTVKSTKTRQDLEEWNLRMLLILLHYYVSAFVFYYVLLCNWNVNQRQTPHNKTFTFY